MGGDNSECWLKGSGDCWAGGNTDCWLGVNGGTACMGFDRAVGVGIGCCKGECWYEMDGGGIS